MKLNVVDIQVNERSMPRGRTAQRDMRAFHAAPRIYVSVQGENILENLDRRLARPSKLYAEAVPQALAALGLTPGSYKASWSQYAGCKCPCSPGFIVKAKPGGYVPFTPKDVWVTVTGSNAAVDPKKPTRGLAARPGKPSNTEELIALLEQNAAQ
jgi:hypothetical protein